MAYDEKTAERVRRVLARRDDVAEKKMMGALAFMVAGNMCCCVLDDGLLVRVDADRRDRVLAEPHVKPMKMGRRTMGSFVRVGREGIATARSLGRWVGRGIEAASSRPPKSKVVAALSRVRGVSVGKGWRTGSLALKARGRIFALVDDRQLVLKLPKARVDALVDEGAGKRFDPRGDGRSMKEWVVLPAGAATGVGLAREAFRFVAGASA